MSLFGRVPEICYSNVKLLRKILKSRYWSLKNTDGFIVSYMQNFIYLLQYLSCYVSKSQCEMYMFWSSLCTSIILLLHLCESSPSVRPLRCMHEWMYSSVYTVNCCPLSNTENWLLGCPSLPSQQEPILAGSTNSIPGGHWLRPEPKKAHHCSDEGHAQWHEAPNLILLVGYFTVLSVPYYIVMNGRIIYSYDWWIERIWKEAAWTNWSTILAFAWREWPRKDDILAEIPWICVKSITAMSTHSVIKFHSINKIQNS
jgi:hypothetical protein